MPDQAKSSASFKPHCFDRKHTGEGIEGGITPTCTCGWIGRTEFAWNDWQMTNVQEQEQEHIRLLNASEDRL